MTIRLGGKPYGLPPNLIVAQFSPEVQQAVGIYNTFSADLQKAQLDVIKCQAALQNVGSQISAAVKAELEKKAAAASTVAGDTPAA